MMPAELSSSRSARCRHRWLFFQLVVVIMPTRAAPSMVNLEQAPDLPWGQQQVLRSDCCAPVSFGSAIRVDQVYVVIL